MEFHEEIVIISWNDHDQMQKTVKILRNLMNKTSSLNAKLSKESQNMSTKMLPIIPTCESTDKAKRSSNYS